MYQIADAFTKLCMKVCQEYLPWIGAGVLVLAVLGLTMKLLGRTPSRAPKQDV